MTIPRLAAPRLVASALLLLPLLPLVSVPAQSANETDWLQDSINFSAEQYSGMLVEVAGQPGLPRTFEHGQRRLVGPEDWTSGFFPGSLWLLYEGTGDARWRVSAKNYTDRLAGLRHFSGHHDVGFMLGCSYGQGYRLTGSPEYRAVLLDGAAALATRFQPGAGIIRSWDFGPWRCPVIVDNMMNLELLLWAAREKPEARWREIAVSHADATLKNHYRIDGSSFHLVDYDPATGSILGKQTVQGFANDSAWARGQAWGLYGFTVMYRETKDPAYLAQATRIANFILNHPHLPDDKVPYWDYNAPDIPHALRDTSAAAITASALIELSRYAEPKQAQMYVDMATQQLRSLSSPSYRARLGENGGFLLLHGVGHIPEQHEVDTPLVYGDYYFLEALLRLRTLESHGSTNSRG